jgi:glycosyltransferase involved in cell wall biosynthesis
MDHDLKFDPTFLKNYAFVRREVERFEANVLHITGLNDISILGCLFGWRTQTAMIGSWHTNLHEFASQRLKRMLSFLGDTTANSIATKTERLIFNGALQYYRMPKIILAPNKELIDALSLGTKRETRLMARGVDTETFSPEKRTVDDGLLRLGFVGRLRPEKNVGALVELERHLFDAGFTGFRFLIVGEGSERETLEKKLQFAEFTGFIDGEKLSEAYANMDVFLFPSETDAFGNVVQEALASGVPVIVTDKGGPKFIVEDGVTGFVAADRGDFFDRTIDLISDPQKLNDMKRSARTAALGKSWDAIFDGVYAAYSSAHKLKSDERSGNGQAPTDLGSVSRKLLRHPFKEVILRWNWKSAILSALLRSPIFFTAYLAQKQGLWIATGAMLVQFTFRTFFGGVNGAILQAFSKVSPAWHAIITVPLVLAFFSHVAEFLIQSGYDRFTGSQGKGGAVIFSVGISIVSALFNLFAMRRGLLLVRDESSQSLWRDLKQMPLIALEFLSFPLVWTWRRARKA